MIQAQEEESGNWFPDWPNCTGDLTVVNLEVGQEAPFAGQLFTNDAASCFLVRVDACVNQANIELENAQLLCNENLHFCEQAATIRVESCQNQLNIMENALLEAIEPDPWYKSNIFAFSGGLLLGVAATVAVVILID